MSVTTDQFLQLKNFLSQSKFRNKGGIITDLDGTAVHEHEGKITIPEQVEYGLKEIHDLGRPVIINTLRFPLSVMRTFGREWYNITNSPIPTILMNGSQLGWIKDNNGELYYDEIDAFPLKAAEINEILIGIDGLVNDNINNLLLFYYPRDWKEGEIIWTPVEEKIPLIQNKYLSASHVFSSNVESLRKDLLSRDICMIFLLIEAERDKLMSYQHSKPTSFFTTKGVDKKYGMEQIAQKLNIDLKDSIGAGDTPMDIFLSSVGLAIIVGHMTLEFKGIKDTIKLPHSSDLGDLLFSLSKIQSEIKI